MPRALVARLLARHGTAWRAPVAAACIIAAAAHVPVTAEHLEEAPYIGVLFILLEVASLALAFALILRPTRAALLAAGGVGGLAIAAFVVSRAIGLPQIGDDIGNWTEPLAVVSVAAEGVMAVGGTAAAFSARALSRGRRVLGAVACTVILAAGLPATVAAAHAEDTASDGMDGMAMLAPAASAADRGGHWAEVAGRAAARGTTRTFYVAAQEVDWDALPGGTDPVTGGRATAAERAGATGRVCVYRGYADASFARAIAATPTDRYLGVLGPTLHVVVGDTVHVVFLNRCSFATSIHADGVATGKNDEGDAYEDVTQGSQKDDDAVAPGRRFTYTWTVPARSGPAAAQGSSVAWTYRDGASSGARTAGLVGAVVVTRAGAARADGTPQDVDREFVLDVLGDGSGPLSHSIDGYRAGTLPMLLSQRGQRVRWYLLNTGAAASGLHFDGNTLDVSGVRTQVLAAAPGATATGDMAPDEFGWWRLDGGSPSASARYVVQP